MKKLGVVLLGLLSALPLHAQDSPAGTATPDASAAPADSSAQAAPTEASSAPAPTPEAAPAGSAPADSAAAPADSQGAQVVPADSGSTPPADASAPTPPAEGAPTAETPPPAEAPATAEAAPEAAPAAERKPRVFYFGADYGYTKVSISNVPGFPVADTTSKMIQGRVGMRVLDAIGVEVHYGQSIGDDKGGQTKLDSYYGAYLVPTGTLLDAVEFGFPLGFAWTKIKNGSASESLDGVSYGMNIEFPFKLVWNALPDIRIGGGGMVYQQNNSARTYGWHAGLRFDFGIGGSAPEVQPVAVAPAPPPEPPPAPEPPPPPPCQAPAPGQPANLEGCKGGETLVLQGVNFEFDKAALTVNAKTLLDQVADELNKHPDIKFEIDGHTDGKGSDKYNQKLSERRAASVKDYLASKNVDASRMTTKGFGESMPIADNNTDEGREQNRRVELKVTETGPAAAATAAPAPAETTPPAPETSTPATPPQ